jgi:O-antigen/teichoic acid export membrane protein
MSNNATPKIGTAQLIRDVLNRAPRSAVAWSLVGTLLRILGGLIVLPLSVRKLPSEHLGLWYVFVSLQGIASLFDLGFSPAVTRAAGYLWAGAQKLKTFGVEQIHQTHQDRGPNYEVLKDLVATMRLYYRFFGIVSGLIMLVAGGSWVWFKTQGLPDASLLRWCYALFVFGGFLNATGDLWPALLSGINAVQSAQKILLGSTFINVLITVAGLLAGCGIWALVLGTIAGGFFLRRAGRFSFLLRAGSRLKARSAPKLELIGTLWPTAWRSGLVSLGAFLVLSANTLICSSFLGLSATASFGLSITLIAMLATASSAFTAIKLPLANQFRAVGNLDEITDIWIRRTRISVIFYLMGGALLLFGVNFALQTVGSHTMALPRGQLALALLIFGLETHHVLYAGLVISENRNPFVAPALISGLATVVLSVILTPRIGVWGLLLAQGFVQACFNNWWTVYRAIHGLGLSGKDYWERYFRTPIRF